MKRAMSLMTVAALGGSAYAGPQIAAAPRSEAAPAPRLLPSGAPACGNVMPKYSAMGEDALCPVFRNLRDLEELGRKFEAELAALDIKLRR